MERYETLIKAVSPEMYKLNAFRVLGLPITISQREISRRVQKIEFMHKLGENIQEDEGVFNINLPDRQQAVKDAVQKLKDPELRLIDEFFWFWPKQFGVQDDNDEALIAIERGDTKTALTIWKQLEDDSIIATHNLAVLSHTFALDVECKGLTKSLTEVQIKGMQSNWNAVCKRWTKCIEHEGLWQRFRERIRELDDARLTTGITKRFRETLPYALLLINCKLALRFAEEYKINDTERHFQIIDGFGFDNDLVDEVKQVTIQPVRERIKIICASAEKEPEQNPGNCDKVAMNLIEQSAEPLRMLDIFCSNESELRQAIHDDIANKISECAYVFTKETEDWHTTLELLNSALDIAVSENVREQLQNNINTVKAVRERITKEMIAPAPV